VFIDSKANDLHIVYYKQHHVQPPVFFKAVQKQRLHKQSYRVVAIEGIHPDAKFRFEALVQQQFPEMKSVLPTLKSTAHNIHGQPIGR
jgi:hypothetical protein